MVFTLNGLILQLSMNLINLTFQVENVVKCRTGFLEYGFFLKDKTFLGEVSNTGIFGKNKIAFTGFG